MKKNIAVIIIFIFVLVFPMVAWPALQSFDSKVAVNENRQKAPFPKFDNNVIVNFDKFFTDRLPIRNSLIKVYSGLEMAFNNLYSKILELLNVPYYSSKNYVLFGKEDWLFFLGDNSLDYYQGSNVLSEEVMAGFVQKAEKVNNYFASMGKEFKIFIAPNKEQIYYEFMPNGIAIKNTSKRVDVLVDYFKKHSNVEIIYPKQALLNAKPDMQLYYKYDTHWNFGGGYIGTVELLKALNIEVGTAEITSNVQVTRADLIAMIAGQNKLDTEISVNYRPEISYNLINAENAYICNSSNTNGKNLLLFGDSFREFMFPTLAKEFTNSIFTTRSSYGANKRYEKELETPDTVIFECVERYEQYMFNGELLDRFIEYYNL